MYTPTDTGLERAILSGICQHGNEALIDVADLISSSSFSVEGNQALYKCLEAVCNDGPVDIASIIAKAEQLSLTYLVCKKQEDIEYLRALFNFPIKLENVRNHAKRLAKLEVIKKAHTKHLEACDSLKNLDGSEDIDTILGVSEQPIFDLISEIHRDKDSLPVKFGDRVDEYLDSIINNPREIVGLPTPFARFNTCIGGGLRRGTVDLIGARPKQGKSTFALNIGLHLTKLNIPVLYVDTELTYDQQLPRILSNLSNVDLYKIERGLFNNSEKSKVLKAKDIIKQLPFQHKSVHGKNFKDILSIIRRWLVTEVGYSAGRMNDCIILYDYFKLMDPAELNDLQEYAALGFQISSLTDFSKEFDTNITSFVQLNRDGISKETTGIISQSDRLLWLCSSFSILKRKEPEEIVEDCPENGNMKFKIIECRFGAGMDYNDYINMNMKGNISLITEINSKFELEKGKNVNDNGFDTSGVDF